MVKKDMVAVIDGRSQDDFVIYDENTETVQHRFDAAASWWTQGITSDKANEFTSSPYARLWSIRTRHVS